MVGSPPPHASEPPPLAALALSSSDAERAARYAEVRSRVSLLLEGERDWVAGMATVACELHEAFGYYHWTGWYRSEGVSSPSAPPPSAPPSMLVIGPYQGSLGCLRIPFARGVCGAAARLGTTQLVPDVHAFPGHIACASSTASEVVVPLLAKARAEDEEEGAQERGVEDEEEGAQERGVEDEEKGASASSAFVVAAVLDVDSDFPSAFREVDARELEELCRWLAERDWS